MSSQLVQLRYKGRLVEPLHEEFTDPAQPPRALRSLAKIIDDGLCHRCGSCVGICPTSVLGLDEEEYPIVNNLSACTDCDLCVKVCPGDELDVNALNQELFHTPQNLGDVHGEFKEAYLSYATDPLLRERSSSGGSVTALLIHLLKSGQIDGAGVISSDQGEPWKGLPMIARSESELLAATKSKYAISPTNVLFQQIIDTPGRYALVGLPCQIHGFHKAKALDRRLRERVVVTVGLFCHAATEHEPVRFVWSRLFRNGKTPVRYIPREGKHPGTPMVEYSDGTRAPVYYPEKQGYRPSSTEMLNILYRMYTPERCLTCYDSTSEFADISVGDPWMAPPAKEINFKDGYSFVMGRTEQGMKLLRSAREAGELELLTLNREVAKECNLETALEKRYRAFRVIETRRRQGHGVPEYHIGIPRMSGVRALRVEINMFTHIFCYLPKWRGYLLRLIFSPVGYWMMWTNQQRRKVKFFLRDKVMKLRRKYLLRIERGIEG
jgi:coenzyme F420 hydrogenase subunit beta